MSDAKGLLTADQLGKLKELAQKMKPPIDNAIHARHEGQDGRGHSQVLLYGAQQKQNTSVPSKQMGAYHDA